MTLQQGLAAQTVNAAVAWLNRVLGSRLPTLPFPGVAAVLTRLWSLIVPGPLPDPGDSLPWVIKIDGALPDVLPGTQIVLQDLSIRVASTSPAQATTHPVWPPPLSPSAPASPPRNTARQQRKTRRAARTRPGNPRSPTFSPQRNPEES